MLLWLTLSIAVALCALTVAVVVAMDRAERRARHFLYTSLGVGDELMPSLMSQRGPVAPQLALVRKTSIMGGPRPDEIRGRGDGLKTSAQRSIRYTRALNGTRAPSHERSSLADRRSARHDRREPS